jgi:acyl-CoA synthetase (AMP-forming)/AMP-acid ligase II
VTENLEAPPHASAFLPLTRDKASFPVRRSMNAPTATLFEQLQEAAALYPDNPHLGSRSSAAVPYEYTPYSSSWDTVRSLAAAISTLDFPVSNPAFLLPNCSQNVLATYACYGRAVPTVPLYPTLGPEAMAHILSEVTPSVYFVDPAMLPSLLLAKKQLNDAGGLLVLCNGSTADVDLPALSTQFATVTDFDALVAEGAALRASLLTSGAAPSDPHSAPSDASYITPPSPNTAATISYTSGTTSLPKGVVLTHRNIVSVCEDCFQPSRIDVDPNTRHFSYAAPPPPPCPLSHRSSPRLNSAQVPAPAAHLRARRLVRRDRGRRLHVLHPLQPGPQGPGFLPRGGSDGHQAHDLPLRAPRRDEAEGQHRDGHQRHEPQEQPAQAGL